MEIPVYLIAGFLDAGKTNFINGVLQDGFAAEDRTLLICCEEGEEEYYPNVLSNVFTTKVEDFEDLTPDYFKKLEKKSEITEDELKQAEKDLQKLTDDSCKKIDDLLAKKEKELMAV